MGKSDQVYIALLQQNEEKQGNIHSGRNGIINSWAQLTAIVLVIELFHIAAFLVWDSKALDQHAASNRAGAQLDGFFDLNKFNTTKTFLNDNKYSEDSKFADDFWKHMQPPTAIISLSQTEIDTLGLPRSAVTPDSPGEMVYQLDIFHSLHCLYKIRQRLLGNETHPHDGHTLHCLNYLWQSLKCNADIMLGTTDTLDDYGLHGQHVCKDYAAIEAWVERHIWKGFWNWTAVPENAVPVPEMLLDADAS